MSEIGHNSGTVNNDQLMAFVARVERLAEEKDAITADTKEIYLEAKGTGFDVKIMRKVVARRKKEKNELQEEEAMIDLYEHALATAESMKE